MSFGPLGWRSSASHNPRLAGLSKPTSSSSPTSRLSLTSASPISRSLTSLPYGSSSASRDPFITTVSNYSTISPSHRREPPSRSAHVRRGSQPSSSRVRASSHTNLSSLPSNGFTSQTYVSPSSQSRSRVASRPVSNASSTTSLNSARSTCESQDNDSLASSLHSLDGIEAESNSHAKLQNSTAESGSTATTNLKGASVSLSESDLKAIQSGTSASSEIDYKKLCQQLLRENETLRRRIKELEEADKKREQEFSREKRSLQRTISEQEEELKSMNDVKSDNVRLKDENAALIRVISKLSK